MGYERYVHILVINRDGMSPSSLESLNTKIKVFDNQATLDQWLFKNYLKIEHGNIKREGNIQWLRGVSKSGDKDVLIIRKERLYE
jgi:hypothetical protein